jgi:HSP20 family protein
MRVSVARRNWDPADFAGLSRLNRMFDDAFASPWGQDTMTGSWVPVCDIFEDEDGLKLIAELPGVNAEDVKISVENNTLTIRGEKKQVAEEKTERVHRYERSYGSFERAFSLPSTIDPEGIEADYKDGLLTIVMPKAERARPREIPVKTR